MLPLGTELLVYTPSGSSWPGSGGGCQAASGCQQLGVQDVRADGSLLTAPVLGGYGSGLAVEACAG